MLRRLAEQPRRVTVDHPCRSAWRSDELCGIPTRVRVALEDLLESLRLALTGDEKIYGAGRVQDRNGKRGAGGVQLQYGVSDGEAVGDLER